MYVCMGLKARVSSIVVHVSLAAYVYTTYTHVTPNKRDTKKNYICEWVYI